MAQTWSTFQENVFNFVANGLGNAVINAVAGSGKTTTIVECAKRIPRTKSVLFLAFNKSIAAELTQRLADYPNVICATSHSHGRRAICKGFGLPTLKENKYSSYIAQNIDVLSNIISSDTEDAIKRVYVRNVVNLFEKCRINLIKANNFDAINAIAEHHSIEFEADEDKAVSTLLETAYSIKRGDKIDYTDMLTLACTQFKRYVAKYDFVFVDECQDLSKAQRELMLLSLKPNGRFIAVGDRNQAINGFAGAGCDSFDLLSDLANNNELPLSVNYRCGKNIINLAQQIVPQITAFEGSGMGEVIDTKDLKAVKGGDMIVCRKTAPLVRLCLKMLANNIVANVKGKDLGQNLVKLIEKLSPKNISFLFAKLDKELEKIRKQQSAKGVKDIDNCTAVVAFQDKIECLQAFAETSKGIADLKRKIEFVFSDEQQRNAVQLSTIHKAKGLEADNVFIIVPNKLPLVWKDQQAWEYQQEMNLKYVAITRAKKKLYFVNLEEDELAKYEFTK